MANNFLILELGTDIKDSKTFKQIMETRHGGRDLTPKCSYQNTKSGTLTYLNKLPASAWNDTIIQKWMEDFVKASPTVLYLSSHHFGEFFSEYFWNDKNFSVRFTQTGLKYGDMRTYLVNGKEAHGINIKKSLVLIIVDGCNIVSSTGSSSGRKFQSIFSFNKTKPIILGFTEKSPAKGTASLHKLFLESLPKSDFSKSFAQGSSQQNKLVEFWVEAGKKWKNSASKRLVAIDNKGNVFDHTGKTFRATMDDILR